MSEFTNYESDAAVVADLAAKQAHLQTGSLTKGVALVSEDAKMIDLERYDQGRNRARGKFATKNRDSFVDYVKANAPAENVRIFIDEKHMYAVAILNFEEEGYAQGHMDYKAVLQAQKTVMYRTLYDMHMSSRCNQKVFAEFLEDWAHRINAYDSDNNLIDNAKAVNAIRNMRIDESVQTDSNVSNYRESRSRLESVEAKSVDGAIPAYFVVIDECYHGLSDDRGLKLRLSISQDEGKPLFKLEIVSLKAIEEQLTQEFAQIVKAGFDGAIEVYVGTFEA